MRLAVGALILTVLALILGLVVAPLLVLAAVIGLVGQHLALDEVQILEQPGGEALNRPLIVDRERHRVEVGTRLFLHPLADQRHAHRGDGRGCFAGQPFAHDQRECGGQRHLVTPARARDRVGAQAHTERHRQIVGDARIAAAAQRFDPRALDSVEHRSRDRLARSAACVEGDVVVPQPEREAVGEPARLRHLRGGQLAGGHRHLQMLARLHRRIRSVSKLHLRLRGDRARGAGEDGLEAVEGGLGGHYQSTLQPKAAISGSLVNTVMSSTNACPASSRSNGSRCAPGR